MASIDARGSTGRGDDFLHAVYRQLGTVDVSDQLEAIRYLSLLNLLSSITYRRVAHKSKPKANIDPSYCIEACPQDKIFCHIRVSFSKKDY